MSDYACHTLIHQPLYTTLSHNVLMQTFLSETFFKTSLEVLDNKRLNKQLLESLQIAKVLSNPDAKAWKNHPAVLQWKGYEKSLLCYASEAEQLCHDRGIKTDKNRATLLALKKQLHYDDSELILPSWWEDSSLACRVIVTHRARLYEKDPVFYFFYKDYLEPAKELVCCPRCNYFWPTHHYKNLENSK